MARMIVCPQCQTKGKLPDGARSTRIRCPKCGVAFNVAATDSSRGDTSKTVKRAAAGMASTVTHASPAQPKPAPDPSVVMEPVVVPPGPSLQPVIAGRSHTRPNPFIVIAIAGLSLIAAVMLATLVMVFRQDDLERMLVEAQRQKEESLNVVSRDIQAPGPILEEGKSSVASPPEADSKSVPAKSAAGVKAKDPDDLIRKIKDATVYIRNVANGKAVSSGTGFVIEAQGDSVLLATNRHVAVPGSPDGEATGAQGQLEAVFRSGEGREREQTLVASIVAADPTDESGADLAILQVKGVREAPAPIMLQEHVEPREGGSYVGAGIDGSAQANPSASIIRGRVIGVRHDGSGLLSQIRVDGSLPSASSGGPILDEKSGRLLGMAVATPGSGDPSGFVLPADEIRRALNGKIGAVSLTLQDSQKGTAELQVKARVIDPRHNIKGVAVHVVPAGSNPMPAPNPDGTWPPVSKAKEVDLKHDLQSETATGSLKVTLNGDGPESRKVLVQTAVKTAQGQTVYEKPRAMVLPEKPGRIQPPGELERLLVAARPKSFEFLGPLLENSRECVLTKDEANLKIRIDIPGKLFSLAPELANKNNVTLHNAPITLTEIDGDFATFVDIAGEMDPGANPPKHPKGPKARFDFTVQSQGLIVYIDRDNFVRFERAEAVFPRTLTAVSSLIVEFVQKGRHAIKPIYREIQGGKIGLLLLKRKGQIRCFYSFDHGKTLTPFEKIAAELPDRVSIGLTASNISTKPFLAEFENFSILNDADKLDQEFGE